MILTLESFIMAQGGFKTGSLDSLGNFGPPYLSTLHGTQSDGNFLYTFTGEFYIILFSGVHSQEMF
jgi:hypothetical protein